MNEATPLPPLAYDAAPAARGDSVFALAGFAVALVCAALPAWMVWQLLRGTRHHWGVYTDYAANIGALHVGANWPWFALDTTALLGGVVGLQRGRPRFAVAAIAIAVLAMAGVMGVVLGSPW